jgi:ABC-type Mn2+/Zn2+ transport system ATPase subunit
VGAEAFAHQQFAKLSGGQKQRVLIARALVTRPDVLVLDEPTAGVDTATTRAVLEFLSQIRQERQITILLATHDFAVVRHYSQQVLWFHHGKVRHGTADELLSLERMAEIFEMGNG